ncbi:MAG TPA: substrate-binding domain-containing protein [Actinospica sp.]|nr:substrate-binding domain-containing protein [Actinospica sp.]
MKLHRAPRTTLALTALAAATAFGVSACGSAAGSASSSGSSSAGVTLILKTLSNPYFVSMENDAKQAAAKDGVHLTVAAGTSDGDTQTQINAIDNAISRGDKGILITTNGNAVNATLNQARQAGLYVIALDTAPTPASVADITYATDNTAAGKLDGQAAAATLGGKKAVIAMLDLYNNQVVSVDVDRDHGFLEGMGIDPGSSTQNGQETKSGSYTGGSGGSYQIACQQPTQGAIDGGRTAMEDCLSANPDINVVYAINEPAAEGAYAALKAAGKVSNVKIYAIDGSCQGIGYVSSGEFAADAVQYPGKMASLGVDSIAKLAKGGAKPSTSSDLDFYNTGTALVTAGPISGVSTETVAQGKAACWGQAG